MIVAGQNGNHPAGGFYGLGHLLGSVVVIGVLSWYSQLRKEMLQMHLRGRIALSESPVE
jgi:hypothetical protein